MPAATVHLPRPATTRPGLPRYVHHPALDEPGAAREFGTEPVDDTAEFELKYMPDEVTRDHARRMHYAAYRAHKARTRRDADRWIGQYIRLRDSIVLGNRKLVYRAVRRRMAVSNRADDLIGDCHIVLIQAVAAYNPWLGIRFSTYAFTCLIRALSRLSQRLAADWLSRALPLDVLPDGGPGECDEEPPPPGVPRLDEYLRDDHPLLTPREKAILNRRFSLTEACGAQTLEMVGRELGLSKERVRQVQACALGKLRRALKGV
jgi:RNA polymerase primary sigma factor/RNA polymerase sigma factor